MKMVKLGGETGGFFGSGSGSGPLQNSPVPTGWMLLSSLSSSHLQVTPGVKGHWLGRSWETEELGTLLLGRRPAHSRRGARTARSAHEPCKHSSRPQ